MKIKMKNMNTKVNALPMKLQPIPAVAIKIAAIVGPVRRATFMMTVLRLTAFATCSGPTRSNTIAWRTGLSNDETVPMRGAMTKIIQRRM
jgi:hypothetical protein